ncbi:MAG: hypothetical protein ACJAWL_001747 [Motiliproteus sp.]|jgi:hypothetical protein
MNLRRVVIGLLVLMTLPLIWLTVLAWPAPDAPATTEVVRLRNAVLIGDSQASDFSWLPDQQPHSFLSNDAPVPEQMTRWLAQLPEQENDWLQILSIVEHLRARGPKDGALQTNTQDAFQRILSSGEGYCADYIQVINALAYAAEIPAREWGMSFDGFGGWGHAFSELYSNHLQKWVFVDVFNGFYATTTGSEIPLSVQEFRQQLTQAPQALSIHRLKQGRFGMRSDQTALDYYQRGVNQFYLWWGTNSLSLDQHPLIKAAGHLSRSLEQLVAIGVGLHPEIRIIALPENIELIAQMRRLKYQLYGIAASELLLLLAAIAVMVRIKRNNARRI